MKFQKGVSLSGLLVWGIILAIGAIFSMKIVPLYIEFGKTQAAIRKVINQAGEYPSIEELRRSYSKFAEVDQLDLKPSELVFKRDGEKTYIEFAYDKTVPLVSNAYLVIKFQGSSKN